MSSCVRILSRRCLRASSTFAKTTPTAVPATQFRKMHSSTPDAATPTPSALAEFGRKTNTVPKPPESRENPTVGIAPNPKDVVGQKKLADFDLSGKVFIVTGGARGLGLSLAEALAETGGKGKLAKLPKTRHRAPHRLINKLQCIALTENQKRMSIGMKPPGELMSSEVPSTTSSKMYKTRMAWTSRSRRLQMSTSA